MLEFRDMTDVRKSFERKPMASKINKSIATALAVMSFGTMFCASSVASTAQAQEVTLDSSVAVVNSDIILRSELDAAQKLHKLSLRAVVPT